MLRSLQDVFWSPLSELSGYALAKFTGLLVNYLHNLTILLHLTKGPKCFNSLSPEIAGSSSLESFGKTLKQSIIISNY